MAIQDMNMQAFRPILPLAPGIPKNGQGGLDRSTAFVDQGWSFYLCKWEANLTSVLVDDLKMIWSDVEEKCRTTEDVREIFHTVLHFAEGLRQQPYFTPEIVPASTIQLCADSHKNKQKWTANLLPIDPANGLPAIPAAKYKYNYDPAAGPVTPILSQKDQCRMWGYASYAIEYALAAEKEAGLRDKSIDPSTATGRQVSRSSASSSRP